MIAYLSSLRGPIHIGFDGEKALALRWHRRDLCGAESSIEIQDTIVGIGIGC